MTIANINAAAITVTDRLFFAGTLATVNSLLLFHPTLPIYVIDRGLTPPQKEFLAAGGVSVIAAHEVTHAGRHIGPWELKAYAASALAADHEVLIGIDSDCIVCGPINDMISRCHATQKWLGGKDGGGVRYDDSYQPYGISPGSENAKYMSTSLYFCPVSEHSRAILNRWAECCAAAVFNGRGPYPGHGDQGVLNAILFQETGGAVIELLANSLWSQHWEYWQTIISNQGGRFINHQSGERQRTFHCGGAEKFWSIEHSRRVTSTNTNQLPTYAWFLAMFWFGHCRNWEVDPRQYLPDESSHLVTDLVKLFHVVASVFPEAREQWRPTDQLLEHAVLGIRRAMTLGTSLTEYIDLARQLPAGAKLVEVGSCEGGSIVPVAISLLDRDVLCYAIESFTGNLDGSTDGWPLPDYGRFVNNVHVRFPHLRIISMPGRSTDVATFFTDQSLDLVFIDASHDTPAVLNDIDAWLPKLKSGGCLAGDDFGWQSVQAAVQERFTNAAVSPSGTVWSVRV